MLDQLHHAAVGVAHGSAGLCYLRREEEAKALPELEKLTDAAERSGVPPEDVAPVRAYLAWKRGDVDGAKQHLHRALTSPRLTARERASYQELLRYLEARDPRFGRFFDDAFFDVFAARLVLEGVTESHALDGVLDSAVLRKAQDVATVVGHGLGNVQAGMGGLSERVLGR